MNQVSRNAGDFIVEAELLAKAFGLDPTLVPGQLRANEITSLCETGMGEDEGRWRLTFYRSGRALRLTVDGAGTILSRATFPAHPPQARST
ncbi:DUF6522 family protein [Paracoccus niistensis]|uniref:DUF6522 family protein n=1 Tax=Paracoccus niistensis TaxID=632935 RepID=A0ABV6I0I8_9RHOB